MAMTRTSSGTPSRAFTAASSNAPIQQVPEPLFGGLEDDVLEGDRQVDGPGVHESPLARISLVGEAAGRDDDVRFGHEVLLERRLRQPDLRRPVADDHELPGLKVLGGRRQAGGLQDPGQARPRGRGHRA